MEETSGREELVLRGQDRGEPATAPCMLVLAPCGAGWGQGAACDKLSLKAES